MKKIMSLIMMALLIVSVIPGALAKELENEVDIRTEEKVRIEYKTDDSDDDSLEEVRIREEIKTRDDEQERRIRIRHDKDGMEVREEFKDRVEGAAIDMREQVRDARDGMKDNLVKARRDFRTTRADLVEAKEKYRAVRLEVRDARTELRECSNDDSKECAEARMKIKHNAKPFLEHTADVVITALERVATNIENSNMPEEEKERRLAEIELRIKSISEARTSAEDLGEEPSNEEIRLAAKEMRESWAESKVELKQHSGAVVIRKVAHVYDQLEKLGERLETATEKLAEEGKDTSEIDALIVEFDQHLANAKAAMDEAQTNYDSASEENINEVAKMANEHLREAHSELKEARETLRAIVRAIREANNGDLSVIEETTAETEVNDDADVDVETNAEVEAEVEVNQ